MQDIERGQRIKAARLAKRLTQPAVIDLLRQRAGAEVVTLRGYQSWESGGGIRWENAKLLGEVLGLDPETVMSGEASELPTPDPFPPAGHDLTEIHERLDRLEALILADITERSEQRGEILERLAELESRLSARTDALLPGVRELLEEAPRSRT